jgi:L,D-peptidoglycan transpeptidase YkuD (ErfK/YbiS/YcfS/YnhG family)
MRKTVRKLHLHMRSARSICGLLVAGNVMVRCIIGRSGVRAMKREGDGATPLGSWRLMRLRRRPGRLRGVTTSLPSTPIRPDDGWCDAPADPNYNRPVRLPYRASHERLWRDDHLYDAIVVLDHNHLPRKRNGGSAIFLHLVSADGRPTQGCVAVSQSSMRKLLAVCGSRTRLIVRRG